MNADRLSEILCQADLMDTGCAAQPDMRDEYWSQARDTAELLGQGMQARQALVRVFEEHFWEGCLEAQQRQEKLARVLKAIGS